MTRLRHRLALLPTVVAGLVVVAVLVAGCSAADPAATPAAPSSSAGPGRADADVVSAAFAADYASGDTPAACSLAAPALAANLAAQGLCQARAGWNTTPHQVARCADTSGALITYQVDREVDRFLLFTVQIVPDTAGHFSVAGLIHNSPGEPLPTCDPVPSPAPAGGN